MGVRENKVEKYLDYKFTQLGGVTRKWVSPGVDGVPDRICILSDTFYVEVKTWDGVLEDYQSREHTRLRDCGAKVTTVFGCKAVCDFIEDVKYRLDIKREYR